MNKFLEKCEKDFDGNVNSLYDSIKINFDYSDFVKEDLLTYNKKLLYRSPMNKFEIYIITWAPFQESPIHDHSENGCLLRVLEGQIIEDLYNTDVKYLMKNVYNKNDISYLDNDIGYHRIINKQNRSVTLHIYSPCNYKAKHY